MTQRCRLEQAFVTTEDPPADCAMYVARSADRELSYYLARDNRPIVISGAARLGKSWLMARNCAHRIRIGLHGSYGLTQVFRSILTGLNIAVFAKHVSNEQELAGDIATEHIDPSFVQMKAGLQAREMHVIRTDSHTTSFFFEAIDVSLTAGNIALIAPQLGGRLLVFENCHYLNEDVQHMLAQVLREFRQAGIRSALIGTWPDRSAFHSVAPELIGRTAWLEIPPWSRDDLRAAAVQGANRLHVRLTEEVLALFTNACQGNITDMVMMCKELCRLNNIWTAPRHLLDLKDMDQARRAVQIVMDGR